MANHEHADRLRQGVDCWNAWRLEERDIQPDLSEADLNEANLGRADLSDVNLNGADLNRADLNRADLSRALLYRAHLNDANLGTAYLSGAYLNKAYLSGAYLDHANLSRASLRHVNLEDANLNGADLSRADLSGAILSYANLSGTTLSYADLSGAYLDHANLTRAYLDHTNFNRAGLSNVNISEAKVSATIFANIDLRKTKGLIRINHAGPSVVQLHTMQLPQDGSALHFLREMGVPEDWINMYRASIMLPIQYYSCFISYCSKDEVLARRLYADLQDQGVRCWFAPEDMKIGDKIRTRIDEAIHLQDKLLLLLSEHAIASTWVEDEVEAALEKEQRQQREVLFPVRLDEQVLETRQSWAAKLRRTRHIGDFTCWTDPLAYQQAFERLLRDFKAETRYGEK